jgi:hypothetical protein
MRRAAIAARVLGLAIAGLLGACSPQIDQGTYFCGPERLCPPGLACDEAVFTCEAKVLARPFACPETSQNREPDDSAAEAFDAGESRCGQPLVNDVIGCLEGGDVDHLRFHYDSACSGDPRLVVTLRFPVAFAPLRFTLTDMDGAVMATGEPCTATNDKTGSELHCVEARLPSGDYVLRVELEGGADCDGDCHYNQYHLDVYTPLS